MDPLSDYGGSLNDIQEPEQAIEVIEEDVVEDKAMSEQEAYLEIGLNSGFHDGDFQPDHNYPACSTPLKTELKGTEALKNLFKDVVLDVSDDDNGNKPPTMLDIFKIEGKQKQDQDNAQQQERREGGSNKATQSSGTLFTPKIMSQNYQEPNVTGLAENLRQSLSISPIPMMGTCQIKSQDQNGAYKDVLNESKVSPQAVLDLENISFHGFDEHDEFIAPQVPLEDEDVQHMNLTAELQHQPPLPSPLILDNLGLTPTDERTRSKGTPRPEGSSADERVVRTAATARLTVENVRLHTGLPVGKKKPILNLVLDWLKDVQEGYPYDRPKDLENYDLSDRCVSPTPSNIPEIRKREEDILKEQQSALDGLLSGQLDEEPARKKQKKHHRKHKKHSHCRRHPCSHNRCKKGKDVDPRMLPPDGIPIKVRSLRKKRERETPAEREERHARRADYDKRHHEMFRARSRLFRIECNKQWLSANIKEKRVMRDIIRKHLGDNRKTAVLKAKIRVKEIEEENEKYEAEIIRLGGPAPQ